MHELYDAAAPAEQFVRLVNKLVREGIGRKTRLQTPNPPGTLTGMYFACGCGEPAQQWYLSSAY